MDAPGRTLRRGSALLIALALVASCGGATPSGTGPTTGGTATPAQSATSGPSATLPAADLATLTKAAQAEVDLVRAMRDELGVAEALGSDGAAVLAAIDAADQRFGERVVAEYAAALGIELGLGLGVLIAAAGDLSAPGSRGPTTATTSITSGALTNTISNYISITTSFLEKADQTQTIPYQKDESSSTTVGTVTTSENASVKMTVKTGAGRLTFDIEITTSTQFSLDGQPIGLLNRLGKGHLEVNGCPDGGGDAPGSVSIAVSELWSAGGRTGTTDHTISGDIHLSADDAAKLAGASANIATSGGGTDGAGGSWSAGGTAGFGTATAPTVTSTGATQAQVDRTTGAGALVIYVLAGVATEAEKFWRSGKCIELKTNRESADVQANQKISLSVDAIHRFDNGAQVKAPINATFSGAKTLEPADTPQSPPASYTFTAGAQKDETGTINLEQTSRRGIAKKTLTFKVGVSDYRISGAASGVGILSGTKCKGLAGAWVVTISGPGTTGTSTFTLPEGGGSAPMHTVIDITVADVKSHLDLNGTASVEMPSGGSPPPPPILHLDFGTGTQTVTSPNGSITAPGSGGTADAPLEVGTFCGAS